MRKTSIIILALFLTLPLISCAQTKQHQNTTQKKMPTKVPVKSDMIKAVKDYIIGVQEDNDGYFSVYDSVAQKMLKLKLIKVHNDKFSSMGDNIYFICSDFHGTDGKKYDIDAFMKWDGDSFSAVKQQVHKVNEKARYEWYEENGIWKTRKPTKKEAEKNGEGMDHPAH